jgi:aspartate-semialdehyde dehydrogenase
MEKVAIVIGATGLIGKCLVKLLAESEAFKQVITFTRSAYDFKNTKVVNHVIDFNNLKDYQDLFQGDSLFSCLGTTLK